MFVTRLHPHKVSKWKTVTVVAIDLCKTELHLVAGTDEPKDKNAPKKVRPGLIAPSHRDNLLAILNGGYKTSHGGFGMMSAGHTFIEPKVKGCVLAIEKSGQVRLGPWPALKERRSEFTAFRQTPPCLIDGGQLHPNLETHNERAWGGQDPKRKTRRRSAMAIDKSGRILFYGFGEETGPRELALGLRYAGADNAAQFDINYSWTRFLLVGEKSSEGSLRVTNTLVPKMVHRKTGYIEKSMPRDFFYVTRRTP